MNIRPHSRIGTGGLIAALILGIATAVSIPVARGNQTPAHARDILDGSDFSAAIERGSGPGRSTRHISFDVAEDPAKFVFDETPVFAFVASFFDAYPAEGAYDEYSDDRSRQGPGLR